MTNYKVIEKVIVFGQSEIVNRRMSLFTIKQRYKYYFSCCIFLYMCVFFLVRIYPSALLSECAFFSCAYIYIFMRLFRCAFFLCAFFQCAFSGHRSCVWCSCKNSVLFYRTIFDTDTEFPTISEYIKIEILIST